MQVMHECVRHRIHPHSVEKVLRNNSARSPDSSYALSFLLLDLSSDCSGDDENSITVPSGIDAGELYRFIYSDREN